MKQTSLILEPPRYRCSQCIRAVTLEELHADDSGLRCIDPIRCKRLGALRREVVAIQAAQRRAKFRLVPGGRE